MKIVFTGYISTPQFKTPETWLQRIYATAGILKALSAQHDVISIEQIDYEGEYFFQGVQYYFKRFGKSYFPLKQHRFIKSLKPDVVFIQGLRHPLQAIQLSLLLGKNVKIMAQNHAELPFTGFKKYVQRVANRHIDAYLFASRGLGLDWISKGNLKSANKIHEVMEVSSVFKVMDKAQAKKQTAVSGSPVFLWVGRLDENKDPLTVVKAFLQFANSYPLARLYMIYHTNQLLDQVKALLALHPAQQNVVKLIGRLPHHELALWFNSADIIISGSHYEGSGTAVCEAMSCGCMPLVTDIFAFRMITDDGRCGLLYQAGNQASLLAALMQVPELDIKARQQASLAYFKARLSFGAIARQIHEIATSL